MIYIIEILNSSFFYFEFIQKRDASYLYPIAYSLESMLLLKSLENSSCLHLKIQRTYLTVEDIVSKKKKKNLNSLNQCDGQNLIAKLLR